MATRKPAAKKRGATSSRRQTARKPARRDWRLPGWLWGLAGLVAGFLLSQHQHGVAPWQDPDSPLARLLPSSAPPPSEPEAPAEPEEPAMPTFEFYTLLPESEVIAPGGQVPASTASPPPTEAPDAERNADEDPIAQVIAANLADENRRPTEPEAADLDEAAAVAEEVDEAEEVDKPDSDEEGRRYVLQAASFREIDEAEQLRGRLRDFGLLAQVSEVKAGGGETWHRVQVGPYDDRREVNRAQDLMVTQGIEPLLIQLNE